MSIQNEIKQLVITTLDIEDMVIDDIDSEAPLFGDKGLGLDSIDALELGIALKKKYNITFLSDEEKNKKHFYSISTLAKFVENYDNGGQNNDN